MIDTEVHIGHFLNDHWDETHLDALWESGVKEAWCSSLSAGTVGMRFGNDEMQRALQREKRLHGLVWVVPYDPDWSSMVDEYLQAGFIGIKLHPPMDRWEPTEAMLGPILEKATEAGVPVVMHAHALNLIGGFIGKYPDAQLVIYHMGGFDGIWLARHHENIWLGLSWCDERKMFSAVESVGHQRMVYGTDSPIRLVKNPVVDLEGGKYKTYPEMLLRALETAVPDESRRRDILEHNARRLLEVSQQRKHG